MQPLQRGDSGEEVKGIQRILTKVGLFDGAIGGNFGQLTEQAVIGFQHLHNGPGGRRLPDTGVVTEATWWALRHVDEARATPPLLQHGDSGDAVKVLQRLLKSRGLFTGAVRGNFRQLTEAAVVAFQDRHVGHDGQRLAGTGRVDADTWWALLHPAAAHAGNEMDRPTLRRGDNGSTVVDLQQLLVAQGALDASTSGSFLNLTEAAVYYFQETHLGPDGQFLEADGIVGPATWWALHHPSGRPQASDLAWDIPAGIGGLRRTQLEIVLRERQAGVKERPDGANWGGGVEKYRGAKGAPWCCYFWSWGTKQALGRYPLGAKLGRCMTAWTRAQDRGMAHRKGDYRPIPGDAFVMLYRDDAGNFTGRGHIGFVLRVEVVGNFAVAIDTVEGNAGNRVKVGRRLVSSSSIIGFINQFPAQAQPTDWQTGLGKTDAAVPDTTT
ncbi:MAG: peptidoglycan-binding protein [Acidimicrobiia bacterium]|nr:peptidoglycan-binding protein [Acidimicrobiia bacterium]MDX2466800.1 peptidoglycan-binding protein [Acidimicrobiia bacterium]